MDKHDLEKARSRLLDEIDSDARDTHAWTGRRRFSTSTMAAMARVPRHAFVLPEDAPYAYINRPRSIGHGQTISQPYIVALMTDLLDLSPEDRVLEIGAGSGYQAAVLAQVCAHVYSVETVEALADSARQRLKDLGHDNVDILSGDGFAGWPKKAPFDAVMVTAAPEHIPKALIDQMKPGARMAIPIGPVHQTQTLYRCTKEPDGTLTRDFILPVAFVPMVRRGKG
jgi:protein-L-isoaspartate(D-aspartate) O-methyltransferase